MDKFTAAVIDQLDGVRVIANVAVGFDNIDVPAATRRKILLMNKPDVFNRHNCPIFSLWLEDRPRRVAWSKRHLFVHSGKWTKWRIDLWWARMCIITHSAFLVWGRRAGSGAAGSRVRHADSLSRRGACSRSGRERARRGIRERGATAAGIRFREPARTAAARDASHDGRGSVSHHEADRDSSEHVAPLTVGANQLEESPESSSPPIKSTSERSRWSGGSPQSQTRSQRDGACADCANVVQPQQRMPQVVEHAPEDDQVKRLGEPIGQLVHRRADVFHLRLQELHESADAEPVRVVDVDGDDPLGTPTLKLERRAGIGGPTSSTLQPARSAGRPAVSHNEVTGLAPGVHTPARARSAGAR